jgi:co-chaperonin GroES (HSP10)
MIQPRNHLIVLKLIEQAEKRVGKLVIPTHSEKYAEAEIVAVGPGTISAEGGRSETHDLRPGQRVLVRHKEEVPQRVGGTQLEIAGIPYRVGDETYYVFPQERVVGIIAQPAEEAVDVRVRTALGLN